MQALPGMWCYPLQPEEGHFWIAPSVRFDGLWRRSPYGIETVDAADQLRSVPSRLPLSLSDLAEADANAHPPSGRVDGH